MVAPSFKDFAIVREQYTKNGKYYVDVKNPKTGTVRSVRWYSDQEYAKNYGSKLGSALRNADGSWKHSLKDCRGFAKGPILVIRNNRSTDEAWLKASVARYAVGIGWHIVSTDTFPADAPAHFKFLLLGWDEFKDGDEFHMKSPIELAEILATKAKKNQWFKING